MQYIKTFEDYSFLPKFTLVTSNKKKLREYSEFIPNLRIRPGDDIPEVQSDDVTVAIYKAIDNGSFTISEDTSLEVEGENVGVNLKYFKDMIHTYVGKKAYWKVLLSKNTSTHIKVYEGFVEGTIIESVDTSFDNYFMVKGLNKTVGELKQSTIDPKLYSARAMASHNLKEDNYIIMRDITNIPEWTGSYQG
mgnify:CR=1 FL=1|jgi:inosine/xanthosine triphosphate pyrophosphatase family protein